jgi:hypothetical protein
LIKNFIASRETFKRISIIQTTMMEIFDSTSKLLVSAESILDSTASISLSLAKIADDIKSELKQMGLKNVMLIKLEKNNYHEDLRIKLRDLHDQNPAYKDRLLHVPR